MTLIQLTAAAGVLGLVAYLALSVTRAADMRLTWHWPALGSAIFLAYSLYTVTNDGLFGFWTEHTESLWGLQVWTDLLLAFAIGWTFLAGRARAQGMTLLPWALFLLTTGCIGLLAMMARVLWLEQRA